MKLDISIRHFGKINTASLKLRPFTVIAGPNSSGKSFATKALYSFFNAVNKDYLAIGFFDSCNEIIMAIPSLSPFLPKFSQAERVAFEDFSFQLNMLETIKADSFERLSFMAQVTKYALLKKEIHALSVTLDTLVSVADNDALMKGLLANVEPHISELKKIVENPTEYLFSAISNSFANALKDNFQISNLADLKNYRSAADDLAQFDFAQLGSVTLKKAALTVALNPDSFAEFRQFNTIVYLESPVYWKMAAALQSVRQDKRQLSMYGWQKINYLTGVPRYVYDLLDQLSHKRKISHPIGLEQDTINAAIGGEIKLSESGDFYFQEHGYADGVGLHSTALGITNLGLISLLLKRGVLGEGSCLFIDEPEAHLHPSWQKVMVEALFELSTKGVNIIIASHSIDMMKCIENIMEREQDNLDLDAHFGINPLSADGNSVNMSDNVFQRIAAIKEDLGQSFYFNI